MEVLDDAADASPVLKIVLIHCVKKADLKTSSWMPTKVYRKIRWSLNPVPLSSIRFVGFQLFCFFLNFCRTQVLLWGHWYCVGLLVTSALGFKARVDSLACMLPRLCTMNSSDSPLVRHLPFPPIEVYTVFNLFVLAQTQIRSASSSMVYADDGIKTVNVRIERCIAAIFPENKLYRHRKNTIDQISILPTVV